jgi:hypothetical protein
MTYKIPRKKEKENNSFQIKADKKKEAKKLFLEDIKKKGTITEKELLLVKRRLNDGTYTWEDVDNLTDLKLSSDQQMKGYKFLYNKGYGKTGKERSTSPYGYREEEALKDFKEIKLNSFTNIAIYSGVKNYVPVYDVYSKEGFGFQYYVQGGEPQIVG